MSTRPLHAPTPARTPARTSPTITPGSFLLAGGMAIALLAAAAAAAQAPTTAPTTAEPPATRTAADDRIPVRTADDLPRHTYPLTGKAIEIIRDDAKFFGLLDAALADAKRDLERYRIDDSATLKGYYDGISAAYVAKGDFDTALSYSDKSRALETKDQDRLMRGMTLRAIVAARRSLGLQPGQKPADAAAFKEAFKRELRSLVEPLPYDLIKDRLIGVRNQAKIISPGLIEASLGSGLDPLIEAGKGSVAADVVGALIEARVTLNVMLDLIPSMAEVYGTIIDARSADAAKAAKAADKWTARLVTLDASASAKPVAVGIWDSGVDTSLFPANLWTNSAETANGKDDDNNGFVDDLHGIAFSLDRKPTTGPLADLSGLRGDKQQLLRFIAASMDMQAGITNAGVEEFQNHYRSLKQEQMRTFTDDLGLMGSYTHGTHVAGIAIAGNPFARLVHITENWPYKSIPDEAPTVEMGQRWGQNSRDAVAYLRKANVRVVNMSWRVGRSAFEGMLEAKGVGNSPEERAELSRKIFAGLRSGLEDAIRSAPEILFVAGSGNEDNDVDFAEYIPAGLRLPNLLTVGAVDNQDRFTDFTTTGSNVVLYANGYRVKSVVPGGQEIEFSGTSMAAPQVTNLVAKILALRPELTPAQVIDLLKAHADPVPDRPGRLIINPRKTIDAIGR